MSRRVRRRHVRQQVPAESVLEGEAKVVVDTDEEHQASVDALEEGVPRRLRGEATAADRQGVDD